MTTLAPEREIEQAPRPSGVSAARSLEEARPELDALAAADLPPLVFFEKVLLTAGAALGANAGAAWILDAGRFGLMAATGEPKNHPLADPARFDRNEPLLAETIRKRQPQRHRLADREYVLSLPFTTGAEAMGAVQFAGLAAEIDPTDECLAAAIEGITAAVRTFFDRGEQLAKAADPEAAFATLRSFCSRVHGSLDPVAVAFAAANESRRLLACDRVTVFVRRGGRYVPAAVSGQGNLRPRSETMRTLATVVRTVTATGERFLFSGQSEDLPRRLETELKAYIDRSETRLLMIDPLIPSDPRRPDESARRKKRRPIGAIVFEQFTEPTARPTLVRWSDAITEQTTAALRNALRHSAVPFVVPLRTLGRLATLWRGRRLLTAVLVAAVLVAGGTLLCRMNVVDRVEARGRLVPATVRKVFAPEDAVVAELFVKGGDHVAAGQPILRLESDDLTGRRLVIASRLEEQQQALHAIRSELNAAAASREQLLKLQTEAARVTIEIRGLETEAQLLDRQIVALTLLAPIDGTLLDPHATQNLIDRPVQRGEALLELADETGDWILEADVPERAAGTLATLLASEPIVLQYRLDSDPLTVREAKLTGLATRITRNGIDEPVVLGQAIPLAENDSHSRRLGGEASLKIPRGTRPLPVALFGDAVNLLRQRLWF